MIFSVCICSCAVRVVLCCRSICFLVATATTNSCVCIVLRFAVCVLCVCLILCVAACALTLSAQSVPRLCVYVAVFLVCRFMFYYVVGGSQTHAMMSDLFFVVCFST